MIDDARTVLERAGVEVSSARTAAAAVEIVRGQPDDFGAVLLDFAADDPEFQRAVSDLRGLATNMQVILFEEEKGQGDVSAWADAVVRKPVHPLALAQQVRESLQSAPQP